MKCANQMMDHQGPCVLLQCRVLHNQCMWNSNLSDLWHRHVSARNSIIILSKFGFILIWECDPSFWRRECWHLFSYWGTARISREIMTGKVLTLCLFTDPFMVLIGQKQSDTPLAKVTREKNWHIDIWYYVFECIWWSLAIHMFEVPMCMRCIIL